MSRRIQEEEIDLLASLLLDLFLPHDDLFPPQVFFFISIREPKLNPPAKQSSIDELPILKDFKDLENECPICQESFDGQKESVKMGCTHIFHKNCLFEWLSKSNSCPTCRWQLETDSPILNESILRNQVSGCQFDACHKFNKFLLTLGCGHKYHKDCLDYIKSNWFASDSTIYCTTCSDFTFIDY